MKKIILFLVIISVVQSSNAIIKVACIGNSVTYGAGVDHRETNCYPAQLQKLLGSEYQVQNFGKSGATLLANGHSPYIKTDEYSRALTFAPDKVIIHLGLNDTDPRDWPNFRSEFSRDYIQLIESFRQVNKHVEVFMCRLTPISHRHKRFKSGTRDWYYQIQAEIERLARLKKIQLIDLQEVLYDRPDLLPDALHPNVEGASRIAQRMYKAISGDYGGLKMPITYTDGMVMQRGAKHKIQGTANINEEVSVNIGNQHRTTKTDENGKWSVTIDSLSTSMNYTLKVSTKNKSLIFNDILIGDVWICSGQSNMAFKMSQAFQSQTDLKSARSSKLRLFNMQPNEETNKLTWDSTTLVKVNNHDYFQSTNWTEVSPESARNFSAIGYYFGQMLSDSLAIPIGLIQNAIGGSPTESWIDRKTLECNDKLVDILYDWRKNDMMQDWVRQRASENIQLSQNPLQRHPFEPAYLYETAIKPLVDFAVKGVIWYQGESNAHNAELHVSLFTAMIESWRSTWSTNMPFLFVQLSGLNRPSWGYFRDSQRRLAETIPNVGMVVSYDKGDSTNVHPIYKKEIGYRLARLALSKEYNHNLIPSGPVCNNIIFNHSEAKVKFSYAKGLCTTNNLALEGFEIAGDDKIYYPATAHIKGETVVLNSKLVAKPVFIRYAWAPFTRANLINELGLPTSTFTNE